MAQDGLLGTGVQSRSRKVRRSARRAIVRQPAAPPPRPVNRVAVVRNVQRSVRRAAPVKKVPSRKFKREAPAIGGALARIVGHKLIHPDFANDAKQRSVAYDIVRTVPGLDAYRHGKEKAYLKHANDVLAQASDILPVGKRGKPRFVIGGHQSPRAIRGQAIDYERGGKLLPTSRRRVELTSTDALLYGTPDFYGNFAATMPLHEIAHTYQRVRKPKRNRKGLSPLLEGGAEAFTQMAAPELGLPPSQATPSYQRYTRRVLRKKGRRYVLKGQFGE